MFCWKFWNKKLRKKPFKVQFNQCNDRRIGCVASTIDELIEISCTKFKIPLDKSLQLVLEKDGTLVDDNSYFQELPAQTILVIISKGDRYIPCKSIDMLIDTLLKYDKISLWNELQDYMNDHESNELLDSIYRTIKPEDIDNDVNLETRDEHESWFRGLDYNASKSKDSVLRDMAKRRIRSYYYSAVDYLNKEDKLEVTVRSLVKSTLRELLSMLKKADYQAAYFSRKCIEGETSICDSTGNFHCQGVYNKEKCEYSEQVAEDQDSQGHFINPYASREQRIIFSTWNLDHRIEKSREILPSLLNTCKLMSDDNTLILNFSYFYSLLFTIDNLRIVHIACHDKKGHQGFVCDKVKMFL